MAMHSAEIIKLSDVLNAIDPIARRNQYDHCSTKLMHAGVWCENLLRYIEKEQIKDPVLKNRILHALDVIADAYNHSKGEYDKVKQVCNA